MTTSRPPVTARKRQLGFVAASLALGVVFAAAGSPVSLYETYRLEDGVQTGQLAVVAATYFVAVAVALLFLGRLSDHLGRKPVAFSALALAAVGCMLMLNVHDATPLIAGRALQGLGGGLASSAVAAYIVDTAPEQPAWLGHVITSTVPMFGLPVGALLSGALVQFGPNPRQLTYFIIVGFLVIAGLLVALSPETVTRSPGVTRSLRPHIHVPLSSRKLLPTASSVILGTWVMGAFYQAFGPAVADDAFGTSNSLVAAAVFASIMVFNPLGGFITGKLAAATKQRLGMAVFLAAVAGVVVSLATGATVWFFIASLVAGAGWGAAFSGSVQGLLTSAGPSDRAGILATVYLISYSAAAIPGLIAGALTQLMTLIQVALTLSVVTLLCSLFVFVEAGRSGMRRRHPMSSHIRAEHADVTCNPAE